MQSEEGLDYSLKQRAFGWLMVHRPFMVILVVLGTLVGYLLVTVERGIPVDGLELFWGLLCVGIFTGAVDVLHEVLDAEVDLVNKPYRPVPRGLVGKKACMGVASWEFAVSISGAFFLIGWQFALFLVFMFILTTHYSLGGKGQILVGQLESTIGSAMVPYAGAVIHGDFTSIIPLCIFIWLFETGRWIMVNLEDLEADRTRGRTLVHVLHPRTSMYLAGVFYLAANWFIVTPYFRGDYSLVLLIGSGAFASALLIFWAITTMARVYELDNDLTGYMEGQIHLWHRNIARVFIIQFQIVLVVEVFV